MTDQDRQLVELITQQVIAVLRERGMSGAGASPIADIHPPIGQCTGDYSKFPELAGKLYGSGGAGRSGNVGEKLSEIHPSPQSAPQVELKPAPIPLSGIVTANQLQAAMDAAADSVAVLAADARLSPLANDLARKFANRVRRAAPGSTSSAANPSADLTGLPWMWWIDGICPVVQEVTSQRASRLRPSGAARSAGGLSQVVRDLAGAIRGRQVIGGLLFVHNAARAMCLANRCASIRAVVGTCGEAVEQGINELGANALVIEYPHHGVRSTSAMVDRMLQQSPRVPAVVERELADLHRCG